MAATLTGIGIAAYSRDSQHTLYAICGTTDRYPFKWQSFNIVNVQSGLIVNTTLCPEKRTTNMSQLVGSPPNSSWVWSLDINSTPRTVCESFKQLCPKCHTRVTIDNQYSVNPKRMVLRHDVKSACPLETGAAIQAPPPFKATSTCPKCAHSISDHNDVNCLIMGCECTNIEPSHGVPLHPDMPNIVGEPCADCGHQWNDHGGPVDNGECIAKIGMYAVCKCERFVSKSETPTPVPSVQSESTSDLANKVNALMSISKAHHTTLQEHTQTFETLRDALVKAYEAYHNDSQSNALKAKIVELEKLVNDAPTLIKPTHLEPGDISPTVHYLQPTLHKFLKAKVHTFLPGPAGSGKTTVAMHIARELKLWFTIQSCDDTLDRAYIVGFMSPVTGTFIKGSAFDWYIHGGIYIIDEADRGNASVMVCLNALLANDVYQFPDGVTRLKHLDATAIATGNTYGRGASDGYVGANQLDAATLDRFAYLTWDYDYSAEYYWTAAALNKLGIQATANSPVSKKQIPDEPLTAFDFNSYVAFVQAFRDACSHHKVQSVISPRASINGSLLLSQGVSPSLVIEATCYKGMRQDDRARVNNDVRNLTNPFTKYLSAE